MRKDEFLRELQYGLEGHLDAARVSALTGEYADRFEEGLSAGRAEDEISAEIGSPAKLSRRLLEREEVPAGTAETGADGAEAGGVVGTGADGAEDGGRIRTGSGGPAAGGAGFTASGEDRSAGTWNSRGPGQDAGGPRQGAGAGDRQYTDFQKKVNRAAESVRSRVAQADPDVACRDLASMGARFGAWLIDNLLGLAAILILTLFLALVWRAFGSYSGYGDYSWSGHGSFFEGMMHRHGMFQQVPGYLKNMYYGSVPMIFSGIYAVSMLVFGGVMLFSTLCLWLTNGYTPGKWLMKIRVVKLSGGKIRFLDALFRECLIKGIANSLLKGFLNMASFVWGCVTEDHKTVQDLAAQTTVVRAPRR